MFEIRTLAVSAFSLSWATFAFQTSGIEVFNGPPKALRADAASFTIDETNARGQIPESLERLRREPLNVGAQRDLALGSAAGRMQEATQGLLLAERTSRRDTWTQLFLIESKVLEGDVAGALKRYDNLLLINPKLGPVLLEKLAAVIGSPAIRKAMLPYSKRPWMTQLLEMAANGSRDPAPAFQLANELGLLGSTIPDSAARGLISSLVAHDKFTEADAVAAKVDHDHSQSSRYVGFSKATTSERLAPLTWRLTSGTDLVVTLGRPGTLDIVEISGRPSTVAERYYRLDPGEYILDLPVIGTEAEPSDLRWHIRCSSGGTSTIIPIVTVRAIYSLSTRFDIPASCQAARLRLLYQPEDHQGIRQFQVGPLTLHREGRKR